MFLSNDIAHGASLGGTEIWGYACMAPCNRSVRPTTMHQETMHNPDGIVHLMLHHVLVEPRVDTLFARFRKKHLEETLHQSMLRPTSLLAPRLFKENTRLKTEVGKIAGNRLVTDPINGRDSVVKDNSCICTAEIAVNLGRAAECTNNPNLEARSIALRQDNTE